MPPLTRLWTDVRVLVADTGRVWWRLLPQILALYLLGWLGAQLALKLAAVVAEVNTWLGLAVFAFGFLSQLTAIVLILRLAGRELGIRDLIPADERAADDRDNSITSLLAVTLLPFLGLYAAFGEVQKSANRLANEQFSRNGIFGADTSILGVLDDAAANHKLRLLLILVAIYLARRLVDYLHERTGRWIFSPLVVLLETFFILVVIMGGIQVWQYAQLWLRDRVFVGWWDSFVDALSRFFSIFAIDLPQVLIRLSNVFTEQVWPAFWEVLSQPIIWLAVAALIYGSHVLSLAELWRRGQPLGRRLPVVSKFAKHSDKVAARRVGPPPVGVQRVLSEVREAFLGDIDDKYLPTFHSLRLVLRAGAIFLGAFVLVYAAQDIVRNYLERLSNLVFGGHQVDFWIVTGPWMSLLPDLVVEPLRLCLLAVAFRRCLELFRARAEQPETYLRDLAPDGRPAAQLPTSQGAGA
ncbi:MAG: hypothetical protein ABWY56_06235 [Propionibacteriaceae bacterium]